MGANDNVYCSVRKPVTRLASLGSGHKPRQSTYRQRRVGKAFCKIAAVLARQQSCWRDNGNLVPCHCGSKGRPHRHLGLTKADIAADQPVHGRAAGQIVQNLGNNAFLILRFRIGETVHKRSIGRRL